MKAALIDGTVIMVDKVVELTPYDPYDFLERVYGEVDRTKPTSEYFSSLAGQPKVSGTYVHYVGGGVDFLEDRTPKEVAKELGIELINQPPDPKLTRYAPLRKGPGAEEAWASAKSLYKHVHKGLHQHYGAEVVVVVIKSRVPAFIPGRGPLVEMTAEFEGKQQRLLVLTEPK